VRWGGVAAARLGFDAWLKPRSSPKEKARAKSKSKAKAKYRGFFATLRMTSYRGRQKEEGKRRGKREKRQKKRAESGSLSPWVCNADRYR